ncbi:hypothetical protein AFL01nite_04940 [Aeromicrobium flavum]|uniref:LA2681-like HEPN domain-containing protein n=1 Tax=Aeromicrobium flavum TaxID=416568 RepID=A0A512HRT8_9ACTN|nr:LA2681 family HEPN domain-containing protein [Aeromicrobium flavum]GEO88167.1 hypothetical protein AFL01nite_04940 [Aeromicrobium flavum]
MDEPSDEYRQLFKALSQKTSNADSDPTSVFRESIEFVREIESMSQLDPLERSYLTFSASSIAINAASDLQDQDLLTIGLDLAERALELADADTAFQKQCQYNVANAIVERASLSLPRGPGAREDWEPQLILSRRSQAALLRRARRLLYLIAISDRSDPHTKSAAAFNPANELDHSGRWSEAFDFYLRSLEADPTNGNAAGNLASMLQHRLGRGVGQLGHLGAVYDKYVRMAKQLSSGTIEFASADVADRWASLQETGSLGHTDHGMHLDDPYREWVAQHRLALSPAVEGLGTEADQWDTAVVDRLFTTDPSPDVPEILRQLNVLKADFIVARELAYSSISEIADVFIEQLPSDSGHYVDTLDMSLFGTKYSRLLLAHRAALDVLDKTAVVANEHFGVDDKPSAVTFRSFWHEKSGDLRTSLVKSDGYAFPVHALDELASDISKDGMYAEAQSLRNAGTHRIVHATLGTASGATQRSTSSMDLLDLIESSVQALQLTRAAYLYLVDLVDEWNREEDHPGLHGRLDTATYSPPSFRNDEATPSADDGPV